MAKKTRKNQPTLRVLFAASEAFPLLKTGGLGDIAGSLPNALAEHGVEMRLVIPAYRAVLEKVEDLQLLGWLDLGDLGEVRVWQAYHMAFSMPLWLVDAARHFDRKGDPYSAADGMEWYDNAQRFTAFSHAIALLGVDALNTDWRPDVVHANDWQTGLAAAFLSLQPSPPRTIYTVHNLAYDCQFEYPLFQDLKLPEHWWSMEHAEFYGRFSLMKAGLVFSDAITTVSPTYAREICTVEYGYGYAGILQANSDKLSGILNGIDDKVWDPAEDRHLAANFSLNKRLKAARKINRKALIEGLSGDPGAVGETVPLIGFVGRLVFQKGVDLLLGAMHELLTASTACFAVIGSGDEKLEAQLHYFANQYPNRVFVFTGYSEPLAHLLEAGCDMFVMPSRYEPCGLTQMYSLRYGTPPIVRRTGGLADTVFDPTGESMDRANGFVFDDASVEALVAVLQRAMRAFEDPELWSQLQFNGMQADIGWQRSAREYLALYQAH